MAEAVNYLFKRYITRNSVLTTNTSNLNRAFIILYIGTLRPGIDLLHKEYYERILCHAVGTGHESIRKIQILIKSMTRIDKVENWNMEKTVMRNFQVLNHDIAINFFQSTPLKLPNLHF